MVPTRFTNRHRRLTGFSLVELMTAMPLFALVVAGATSAVLIASKAKIQDEGLLAQKFECNMAIRDVAEDLESVISFSKREAHEVELTVHDRDGDDVDDKLRYTWSGVTGDPLYMYFKQQPGQIVADDVHLFELSYVLQSELVSPLAAELALLKFNDDSPGGHFHDESVEPSKWYAQYFLPTFPESTTEWKIKRARFMAKCEGDNSETLDVRLTTADAALKPTNTIIDRIYLPESLLDDNMSWVDVYFTSANQLDPNQGLCLVIAQASAAGKSAKVSYNHGGNPMPGNTHWMKTDNGGASWSDPVSDKDMRFFIWGTYDNYLPDPKQFLVSVDVSLQLTDNPQTRTDTSVYVINSPEVIDP